MWQNSGQREKGANKRKRTPLPGVDKQKASPEALLLLGGLYQVILRPVHKFAQIYTEIHATFPIQIDGI